MGSLNGDIQVISVDPTTGRVSFGLVPQILTGYQKLVQIVVLSLLNTPGKDILNPADGGGILSMIGTNIESVNATDVLAELNMAVSKTQTEVINYQTGITATPDELLSSLQVISLTEGQSIDEVLLTLRIINQAGRSTDVVL